MSKTDLETVGRFLPLLLVLMLAATVQAQFNYTTDHGAITITGYTGPGGAVTLPGTIQGLPVTSIGEQAFVWCTSLTSVTIPKGITNIGPAAFNICTNLTSITVDSNNPAYCSMDGVLFDKSQTTILQYPGGKAGNYTVPNGVTNLPGDAFFYCPRLVNIAIPGCVSSIGVDIFNYCPSLTSITVDTNNPVYSSLDGVLFNKSLTALIRYRRGKTAAYLVPEGVTSIEASAFQGSSSLTNVTIPDSVTSIDGDAFWDCASLTSITVDTNNPIYSSLDGVLFNQSQTTLIRYPEGKIGTYLFPNCITSIGMRAFWNCHRLINVTIPNSVTNIADGAFYHCLGLTNITIPDSVQNIGNSVLMDCTRLARVSMPNGITNIAESTFWHCTSLTSVTIPKSVASIGQAAFRDCTSLTSVYCQGNAPSLGSDVFLNANMATVYYLPGTANWETTLGGRPTRLWNPQVQTAAATFGIQGDRFGFTITGTSNLIIVVEASTNLANPAWTKVRILSLTDGSAYFSDPQWTNYPSRFYRLRSP